MYSVVLVVFQYSTFTCCEFVPVNCFLKKKKKLKLNNAGLFTFS